MKNRRGCFYAVFFVDSFVAKWYIIKHEAFLKTVDLRTTGEYLVNFQYQLEVVHMGNLVVRKVYGHAANGFYRVFSYRYRFDDD